MVISKDFLDVRSWCSVGSDDLAAAKTNEVTKTEDYVLSAKLHKTYVIALYIYICI